MSRYTHEDGREDSIDDLITSLRCFAVALGHILEEKEGIIIELPFNKKYPDHASGKYMVWKESEMIGINLVTPDESEYLLDDGQMLWVDI